MHECMNEGNPDSSPDGTCHTLKDGRERLASTPGHPPLEGS